MCISNIPSLLYYAYLPTIFLGMFFGIFVYLSGRKEPVNKILVLISIVFSFYTAIDFMSWFPFSLSVYTLFSKLLMLVLILLPLLLYFAYYLLQIKISLVKHIFVWIPFIPLFILSFSKYSHLLFSIERVGSDCVVQEETLYPYIYALSAFYIVWFVLILFKKYRASKDDSVIKNKIKTVIVAASVLIGWFVLLIKLQSFFGDSVLLFIPLGMVMFIGILSYAIVKYKLFNIKLLTAQAIVVLLVFLIGALIFMQDPTKMRVVIWITLVLVIIFGRYLIKSVKAEVKKSEELEIANAEISKRGEELEKMAQSLAVSNDQLKIANNKLQELDQAKSDFFARASHDLRTPLTSIKGFISLLQEGSYGEVPDPQKDVLVKVFTVAQRMNGLVEDFLSASKLEAGGMQYNFDKCKVENVCKEIADMLFTKAKDKGLYLDFKKPQEEMPEVTIDASRIMESVSNLVDNAVKYTEKGGITIKLEHAESSNYKRPEIINEDEEVTADIKGAVLRITVADTGMGIPKDGIDLLFAKYSRGKGDARAKTKGTGLGLYVGKRMIEDNGGKVWAESDGEGLGSRFIVELPVEPPVEVLEKIKKEQQMQKVI